MRSSPSQSNEYLRARYANDPAYRRQRQNYTLLQTYGISVDQRDALLSLQGGRCAICAAKVSFGRRGSAHIDHNHRTGKVRGILCNGCNVGVGMFRENPNIMQAATQYLRDLS